MDQRVNGYDEQLSYVRLMAEGHARWALLPHELTALTAVLRRYDAYEAVVRAAQEVAVYDDFGEELSPNETLTAPSDPRRMNDARTALYKALTSVEDLEKV